MAMLVFLFLCADWALLIKGAQLVGGIPVLLEVLATGVFGWLLIRQLGRTLRTPRLWINLLADPAAAFRHAQVRLLLPGLLLILPGVLTDVCGIALYVASFAHAEPSPPQRDEPSGGAIDVEFKVHSSSSDEDRTAK